MVRVENEAFVEEKQQKEKKSRTYNIIEEQRSSIL